MDGSSFTVEATLSSIEIDGRARLLAVLVDLSTKRKPEKTLAQLAGRLLQLHDEERRRIASDIHDGITQRIVGIWYRLLALEK